MALAKEDDAPVALCLQRNDAYINWRDTPPEEVIYVPESLFEFCAPKFLNSIGERYYDTTGLSKDLLPIIEADLERATAADDENVRTAAGKLLEFVARGKQRSATHYLAFEGP